MDLLERILNAVSDTEADKIIKEELIKANAASIPIEQLGFSQNRKAILHFKGFIPLSTRIQYEQGALETYSMQTVDYFYEFAHFLRKNKIKNKSSLIHNLEGFLNQYFGLPGKARREDIFYTKAFNSTEDDNAFFEALKNNKIGDLKGLGAAECTERGAVAQEILNLFGTECYYCIGCVDLGNKQEPHCFNIVKRKNDYALLDYSVTVSSYAEDGRLIAIYPFVGSLSNDEFIELIDCGVLKSFQNYEYVNSKKVTYPSYRTYVVGSLEITHDIPSSGQRGKV